MGLRKGDGNEYVLDFQSKKLACILMVFSKRIDKRTGKQEQATRYYISSKNGTAKDFHTAIRSHGGIENKLHWLPDRLLNKENLMRPPWSRSEK